MKELPSDPSHCAAAAAYCDEKYVQNCLTEFIERHSSLVYRVRHVFDFIDKNISSVELTWNVHRQKLSVKMPAWLLKAPAKTLSAVSRSHDFTLLVEAMLLLSAIWCSCKLRTHMICQHFYVIDAHGEGSVVG